MAPRTENKTDGMPMNPSTNKKDKYGIEEAAVTPTTPSKKTSPIEAKYHPSFRSLRGFSLPLVFVFFCCLF
jgi:hypothetical protein